MLNLKRTPKEQASDRHNQKVIARALPKNYFQGLEGEHAEKTLTKRRAKNKVARASRRANRR